MKKVSIIFLIMTLFASCTNKNNSTRQKKTKLSEMENDQHGIAFPKIFELAYKDGHSIQNPKNLITFQTIELGNINISSGKIIACDPLVLHDAIPFKHEFPIGNFPVQISVGKINNDERIGFSRILFSENKIKEWKFALLPDQEEIPLTDEVVHGYGVDTSLGLFIDEESRDQFVKFHISTWEDVFVTKMRINFKNTWSYLLHEFDKTNLATFYSGFGDGSYATYIGFDKNGEISQLLTDFDLVDWWMP